MKKYHRLTTRKKNQDLQTAVYQLHTRQIWGGQTFNNDLLAVKAFHGQLPDSEQGIEFMTDVPPSENCSTPKEAFWYKDLTPEVTLSKNGAMCCLDVTITKIRYTTESNLRDGIDCSFEE